MNAFTVIIVLALVCGLVFITVVWSAQLLRRSSPSAVGLLLGPVLAATDDAMVVSSREGIIELVNTPAERLFGYAPGRMNGCPIDDLIPLRFHEEHHAHFERFFDDPQPRNIHAISGPIYARRRDGSEFRCEIGLAPVASGRVLAVIREVK